MTIRKASVGFSLVEMMIVLVIIGMIVAAIAPMVMGRLEEAKKQTTRQSLKGLQGGIQTFYMSTSTYPQKLRDLVKRPANVDSGDWSGPYAEDKHLEDAWKHSFVYKLTPDGEHEYELYSHGPKGKKSSKSEWINVWSKKKKSE